ncbi:MAG: AEC family transporter, partial [Erysipelotrichaceae bacterium]|nr:AEC family transporter [Erysipelotrichaceae bacterium]
LYVGAPCAIVNSFLIELTADRLKGFLLAIGAAVVVHVVYLLLSEIFGRLHHFNSVEKMSTVYSNSGNLIIPLVTLVLGEEMVFYCSGYMIVQTILMWTHCKISISEERDFDIKKIIFSINMLAIYLGAFLCLTHMTLPTMIASSMKMMAGTMAPLSMFVIGMLLADMDLVESLSQLRPYLVCFYRLIVFPMVIMLIILVSGVTRWIPDAGQILMISMLSASAPVASTVAQFAQLYHKHEFDASVINGLSILLCIVTMPAINVLYNILFL